ncbi:MAG: pyrroline-5-carboxylate reductase [Verrucomicrobiales bacterium]
MKLGLIGCGKMGSALLLGILAKKLCRARDVTVRDSDPAAVAKLRRSAPGVRIAKNTEEIVAGTDAVLVCVKPTDVPGVMAQLGRAAKSPLLISIAAGVKIGAIEKAAGAQCRVARVMPNTPALIGKGAAAYALGSRATNADGALTEKLLGAVGTVSRVDEKLLDAVTGVSGSGPAYVYLIIEALADAGVLVGLAREVSLQLAAQTVAGAAEMVLRTGQHPGALRDQVASPGGTTIAGIAVLEERGLRSALIEAVRAATARSVELGK